MELNIKDLKYAIPSGVEGYVLQTKWSIGEQQDYFISIFKQLIKILLPIDLGLRLSATPPQATRNDEKRLQCSVNCLKMASGWSFFDYHQTFDMRITPVYIARL